MNRIKTALKAAVLGAVKGAVSGAATGAGSSMKGLSKGAKAGLEIGVQTAQKIQIKENQNTLVQLITFFANNPELQSNSEEGQRFIELLNRQHPTQIGTWFANHLGLGKAIKTITQRREFGMLILNQLNQLSTSQVSRVKLGFEKWQQMNRAERVAVVKAAKTSPLYQIEIQPKNIPVKIEEKSL